MLMRPTRVAAVICHALSPELSHDAYGFTASFLDWPAPRAAIASPGSGVSRITTGRPLRCPSGTPLVSHGRVSDTFPGRYAMRAVQMPANTIVSTVFRLVQ